jgi:fatty acid desaturase
MALGLADALVNYALMTWFIGPYTGAIFLVNHIGTRVVEPEENLPMFVQEIAVTRNLGATRLHNFLFGGVNNHIEHHLFPSMPSARLPQARRITREFCQRHGIAYREMSWFAAAREVTQHFRAMSAFVPH